MKKILSVLASATIMLSSVPFTASSMASAEFWTEEIILHAPNEELLYTGSSFYLPYTQNNYYRSKFYTSDESVASVSGSFVTINGTGTVQITGAIGYDSGEAIPMGTISEIPADVENDETDDIPTDHEMFAEDFDFVVDTSTITLEVTHDSLFASPSSEGLLYEVQEDGTALITGYEGKNAYLLIPEEIDGYKVSGIAEEAIGWYTKDNFNTQFIDIEAELTELTPYAFVDFWNLRRVKLPDGLEVIDKSAFGNCRLLSEINIPDTVKNIGDHAFGSCYSLAELELPYGLETIGDVAFGSCELLESLVIPETVTELGGGVFSGCTSLTSITIPDSVTTLKDNLFSRCTALEEVILPDSITVLPKYVFNNCESLTDIILPSSLVEIQEHAFSDCTSLEKIDFPDGLTTIGDFAFTGSGLKSVSLPESITTTGEGIFRECLSLVHAELPDNMTTNGKSMFSYCSALETVKLPANLEVLGAYTFSNCTSLKTVDLPEGLKRINSYSFYLCSSFSEVTIPESVEYLGPDAFRGTNLTEIVLPENMNTISDYAFIACEKLAKVNIPEKVTMIENYSFAHCLSLTEFVIPQNITIIEHGAFLGSENITEMTFLNPDCKIWDTDITLPESAVIYGYEGSTAQAYAEAFNRSFIPLVYGDTDNDGEVKMADVIRVMLYSANPTAYPIDETGLSNADVYQRGDGIDVSDALSMQKLIAQAITTLPESAL
ncbi:MAG: leucine-rich repeat protein [Ruminococcus sp.]|nr:leucine-rich repeat protein [Ruminococcus sp.]